MGFSEKQIEIFTTPYRKEYDGLIADGAIRSGKTSSMSLSFVLWAMATFNNKNFIIAGKTIRAAERNLIKELLKVKYLHQHYELTYNRSEHLLTIKRGKRINMFYIFGGQNEKSQDLVQGITAAGALLDEVALMPQSFVNQVIARCSVEGAFIFFNCNPDNPNHFFKQEFIDKAEEKNYKYLHFTMEDNPSLSEKTKERYRKSYSGVFFKRYIEGLWVRAEGIIYDIFANNKERYLIDHDYTAEDKIKELWTINCGIDFGNNKSSHTFQATAITRNFEKVVFLMSRKVSRSLTPKELDAEFNNFVSRVYSKYGKVFNVRCDSAETTLINGFKLEIFNSKLFFCDAVNALKTPINERIKLVCRLFAEGRIEIVESECKDLIQAFETAVWDEKHAGERLDIVGKDNPVDMLDAAEYSIEEFADDLLQYYYFEERK